MRIFFLLWGLLTAFMVAGQVKISGHVKNQNGKPVSGVSILLKGTYDGTTSDSLGNFSFETTEKGNQQLEASSTGYTTYNTIIQIENKNIINVNTSDTAIGITAVPAPLTNAPKNTTQETIVHTNHV